MSHGVELADHVAYLQEQIDDLQQLVLELIHALTTQGVIEIGVEDDEDDE